MQPKLVFVLAVLGCCVGLNAATLISQPLGIAGQYLTTQIGIGKPPQYFDLGIDLTSDKSIIIDAATQDAAVDFYYDYIKQVFDPVISDTANLTKQICRERYHLGTSSTVYKAYGHYVDDYITLGGSVLANPARFCDLDTPRNASYTSQDELSWLMGLPIDGFVGFAPGGENIVERAMGMSQVTLYVNKQATESDNSGVITFGGQDTKNCKSFRTFPTQDTDTWRFWLTKASFNSKEIVGTFSTIIDLTTDRLVVPSEIYSKITSYFGNKVNYISCSTSPPDLKLNISGKEYNVPIKPYLVKMASNNGYCELRVGQSGASDDDQIVLGRHFLDNNCIFLDFAKSNIGFAEVMTAS